MPSHKTILQQLLAAHLLVHSSWALPAAPQLVVRDGLSGPAPELSVQPRGYNYGPNPGKDAGTHVAAGTRYQAYKQNYPALVTNAKNNLYAENHEYRGAVHDLNVEKTQLHGAVRNLNVEKTELYGARKNLNGQVAQLKGVENQRNYAIKDLYGAKYQLGQAQNNAAFKGHVYDIIRNDVKAQEWKSKYSSNPLERTQAGYILHKDMAAAVDWRNQANLANKQVYLDNGKVFSDGARVNALNAAVVGKKQDVGKANVAVLKEQGDVQKAQSYVNKELQDVRGAQYRVNKEHGELQNAKNAYNNLVHNPPHV